MSYSRRRSGRNDVSRLKAHEAAQVADKMGDAKDHRAGRAILIAVPIDFEPELQALWIGNLICCNQPRTDRAEGIRTLAFDPLPGAFQLEGPLGEVVDNAVACDMRERILFADVLGLLADHDAKFHLLIGFLRALGNDNLVVGTADGGRGFHEENRFRRNCHT